MAEQAQQTQQDNTVEVDPNDPMEILRSSLMQDQVQATEQAAVRLADAGKAMVMYEGQAQTREMQKGTTFEKPNPGSSVTTNASVSALYEQINGQDYKYVGSMPAGSKLTAKTPNLTTKIASDGTVEIFAKQVTPEVPPNKVFQSQQQAYSRPQGPVFNLENEEAKLKELTGEERLNAITMLLSNIDAEMTKSRQRIGQQAAIQSGYTAAQTALDRSLAAEHLPNPQFGGLSFNQRFGVASAQTVQAQEFLRATQIASTQLEESMRVKDAEYTKYFSARDRLMKIEGRTAERQAREEARSADRAERAADVIPQYQTAAMQALNPTMSAEQANKALITAGKNNKPVYQATLSTPENIYVNLMHPDLAVRQATLEVLKNHDRANNVGFENSDKTPTTELIKKFVQNPGLLEKEALRIRAVTAEDIKQMTTQLAGASTKEKSSLKQANDAHLLQRYIEKTIENSYTTDMRRWKATETSAGTQLGSIIESVSKTNPSGSASMGIVIERFINDVTYKNPDGTPVPYEQRVQMLQAALTGAVGNEFKTMLRPDLSDVQNKLMTQISNASARARIAIRTPATQTMGLSENFGYKTYGTQNPDVTNQGRP